LFSKSGKLNDLFKSLHIENSTKVPIYEFDSDRVDVAYASDNLVDYSNYYNKLIEMDFPLLVLSGEFDARDGAISQFDWMKKYLNLPEEFWEQDRKIYYYNDEKNKIPQAVGGYW